MIAIVQNMVHSPILRPLFIALWAALLLLPFAGISAAATFFIVVLAGMVAYSFIGKKFLMQSKVAQRGPFLVPVGPFIEKSKERLHRVALPLLLVAVVAIPFIAGDYSIDVLTIAGIYIILALGLNIIVGFTGQLNLGFAGFYAIGAYTYAVLSTRAGLGFWTVLPLSALLTACAGFFLAIPALRLRGDYLAIVTLGFGEIIRLVLNNWDSFTNGPNGISGIAPPELFGISLGNIRYIYYLVFLMVIIALFIIRRVECSRIGRAWVAIREDEIAASSMGINTTRYKLYAFMFGTFWAGIAGQLFAAKMQFVSPESFTFIESVFILGMVILGGLGSTYGAVVGALIIALLPELLRGVQSYRMLILGIGLVILMVFRPQGIFGGGNRCS